MPLNLVAKVAVTAALTAANMALTMSRKIEGPRLDDLKFSSGDYGAALHMVWGTRRLDVPIFWGEDLREVKRRRKTKGGKFNEYTYYGTWAVALAGHEIEGVRRIWFDTHLIYDLSGAGPVTPFDFGGTGSVDDFITVYPGSETQEPDPRIQATEGEENTPAYRGTAYVVFKDIPLEKLGNRIPQVSVEIVTGGDVAYPYDVVEDAWENRLNLLFSPDKALLWIGGNLTSGAPYAVIDAAARANIITGSQPAEVKAFDPSGTAWGLDDANGVVNISPDGSAILGDATGQVVDPVGSNTVPVDVFAFYRSDQPWIGIVPWNGANFLVRWQPPESPVSQYTVDLTGTAWAPAYYFQDADGDIWATGKVNGATTTLHLYSPTANRHISVSGLSSWGGTGIVIPARHYLGGTRDHFLVAWDDDLLIVDRETGALLDTVTTFGDSPYVPWKNGSPTDPTWFQFESSSQFAEYSATDGSLVRVMSISDWDSGGGHSGGIYDPISHAWIGLSNDASATWYFLDRIGTEGVTLETVCNDVSDWCGVTAYDFSNLNQIVQGWSATRGQSTNIIEPLLEAFDSDIRPHDFTIQGLKRTGTTGGTLLTERFVANEPRYTVAIRQAAELPLATLITFADVNADQQPFTVRSDRGVDTTDAKGEKSIDMGTLASDADEMRGLSDRFHRRIWNERREASLSLTAQQLGLEPGDVRTLELDGESMTARLIRVTVAADDTLATEWRYDHPSLAVIDGAAGATFDGRDESIVVVPLLTKGFALDIPLLADVDNDTNPQIYYAAAPYAAGTWPGAVFYEETGGEYTDEAASVESSAQATWGYANEALPDANPWLWDRGSSVNVTIQNGSLTGTTEAAIDADPTLNQALLGDEIINFTTATLEGDGTYTLSGFKRGRRGTEWACASHADRDVFLLLDTAEPADRGLSDVGTDLSFKAVTSGRTDSGAFPIPVSFTGASLKPYAPVHLEAVKESNGDWTLTWVRRSRIGGAWTSGTSIPLGEATEEYELDLSDGTDTVTKAGLTSPTYTWTQADQITDVGAEVMAGDLEWTAVQISAAVDRGFEASATA